MIKLPKILITSVIFFLITAVMLPSQVSAYSETAASSAALTNPIGSENKVDKRIRQLRLFLASYDSPLADYANELIFAADKYGLDWKLVPAITGVESTFGKQIPYGSYNAYGWANGNFYFKSWPESIEVVSKTLKERYVDRGADTVEKIAPIYAPPSQTWAGKVRFFVNKIENFGRQEEEFTTLALSL